MKKFLLVLLVLSLVPLFLGGCSFSYNPLQNLEVYPNPFVPSKGHAEITFCQLPPNTEIYIFTLSGELIIDSGNLGERQIWIWDAKNKEGKEISRGIYTYIVTSQNKQKIGKITVIK